MKKYLKKWYFVAICFISAMLLCCLSGCCDSTGVTKEEPTQTLNVKYYYKDPIIRFYTAEIEGHLYIIYDGPHECSVLHAEHCPCKMK